jgi:hypothetical protein
LTIDGALKLLAAPKPESPETEPETEADEDDEAEADDEDDEAEADEDDNDEPSEAAADQSSDPWAEANEAHENVIAAMQSALDHGRRCGEVLGSAKREVGETGWAEWLANNCPDISVQDALDYIWIAEHWDEVREAMWHDDGTTRLLDLLMTMTHQTVERPGREVSDRGVNLHKEAGREEGSSRGPRTEA